MSAPVGYTDMLTYMMPPTAFSANFHLGSSGHDTYSSYDKTNNILYQIKTGKGYPLDSFILADDYVYQWTTEGPDGWNDPTDYKAFVSKSFSNSKGGVVWCPRYFIEGVDPTIVVTEDSSYNFYKAGKQVGKTSTLGGPITTILSGPFMYNCEGDLGFQLCTVQDYLYTGVEGNGKLERRHYAKNWGPVRWELLTKTNGIYVRNSVSIFNMILPDGTPKVNFVGPK